jgi:PKD repeat protein
MRKVLTLLLFLSGWFFSSAQCPEFLNIDTAFCSGAPVKVSADASILKTQLCGDSITITYNAANAPGAVLSGDSVVYMYSGPQFTPFSGWQTAYTAGVFGVDSGAGRMTSLGNNVWTITINPRTYFGYPVDSCLDGFYMVFRNYNGSSQDPASGNNYFIYTRPGTPSSNNAFITATETYSNKISYLWSDGNTDSSRTFTSAGTYTVTATGVGGCSATGTVNIKAGHAPVTLGNDTTRCTPGTVVLLTANTGFISYTWVGGGPTTSNVYGTVNTGCFWVDAVDSAGCTSSASISVQNSQVNNLAIPDSLNTCPGGHLSVNASQNVNLYGDSVVIVFNATGTTLANAGKVYFYSAPELHPGSGWDNANTVGTWGVDNGVGEMSSLGNNMWQITIDPYCYYQVNPDTQLYGILYVLRNADGSAQEPAGLNNYFVGLAYYPPSSTYANVTVSRTAALPLTYSWSNNTTGPAQTFTSSGTYTVTLSDNNGCSKSASVVISFSGTPPINLGADTSICAGNSVTLSAPAGYSSYRWSNDSTGTSITVSATGDYSVTATDSLGCQSTGSRNITVSSSQVSLGNNIFQCSFAPATVTATPGFKTYQWLNGTVGTSSTYSAAKPGPYWVAATDNAGCVSYDTISVQFSNVLNLSLPDTATNCPGNLVPLNAATNIEQKGDSLVIIYDDSQGETQLQNSTTKTKVYFHSSPQFYAGQGWNDPYTVGNWGVDNGIGEMDSIDLHHWKITINPYDYYHINPDTPLTGIWMVFRNADGTETGKDETGNNILLSLTGVVPSSTFTGVYGFRQSAGNITYLWSDGNVASSIAVSAPGVYSVTATDVHGCSMSDSVNVLFTSNISVSLGNDTTICSGQSITLSVDSNYSTYHWSVAGDSSQTLTVSAAGTYTVSVAIGNCSATASINVGVHGNVVTIGNSNNVVRCSTAPVTLTASSGFTSYLWYGTGTSSQTYSAVDAGLYWVKAIDNIGCTSYDTVTVSNSPVLALTIPDSSVSCGNDTINLDPSVAINAAGDSLVIVYDATQGNAGLLGATKVYFHSGPQTSPGGGWDGPHTVGNWGLDDGVGEMTYLGNSKWTITIDPRTYYGLPADTPIYGIWMVFRNANGSVKGATTAGGNILLDLTTTTPSSTFSGISGTWKAATGLTYNWSNGVTTSAITISSGGTFKVTVTDLSNCSNTDSIVVIQGQPPLVSLPADTTVCPDSTIELDGGSGFSSYVWSSGASTEILYVNTPGIYTLTVTNTAGCSASASVTVDSCGTTVIIVGCGSPSAGFYVQSITPFNSVTFIDTSHIAKAASYVWNFGDGDTSQTLGSTNHTYGAQGIYTVSLTVNDSCGGTSTDSMQVDVNFTGIISIAGINSVTVYPNPTSNYASLEINAVAPQTLQISLINTIGDVIWVKTNQFAAGKNIMPLNTSTLAEGMYWIVLRRDGEQTVSKLIVAR